MNYTNREVVRRLKQYDMFLSSLELTNDDLQRERICDQLDKIEKQILLETNTEYEEEYMTLLSEEPKLFSEEKARLRNIISLIEDRKKRKKVLFFIENRSFECRKRAVGKRTRSLVCCSLAGLLGMVAYLNKNKRRAEVMRNLKLPIYINRCKKKAKPIVIS